MPSLLDLQRTIARSLLQGDDSVGAPWLDGDPDGARIALAIHRNNVQASLGAALADMFPVVRRLVGDRFFSYAAHEFLAAHPPADARVDEYGAGFADFLAAFAPVRDLAYLSDVARFERLLYDAARVRDEAPLDAASLRDLAAADAARLGFGVRRSYGYLASGWPVAAIWRANQPDRDGTVIAGSAGARIEVCRRAAIVEFRELAPAPFAFRAALARGSCLADALDASFTIDPSFDATAAIADRSPRARSSRPA